MIVFVTGVSGSGKTTLGRRLAERLGWVFFEGDEFHPASNIEKMEAGIALSDEDREPWLQSISQKASNLIAAGTSAIMTCSALTASYRRKLRVDREQVRFIFLKGAKDLLSKRIGGRTGHFMPASLLDSQLATLEEPGEDEALILDSADDLELKLSKASDYIRGRT